MARPRYKNKHIEAAIRHAESRGWRVQVGGSHAWGFLLCPEASRDGCDRAVLSTPTDPQGHARDILKSVDRCPHRAQE
ncbi:hypothetical protein EP7_005678 (plasmid) [Isosphaeraceae bacterium EP7]